MGHRTPAYHLTAKAYVYLLRWPDLPADTCPVCGQRPRLDDGLVGYHLNHNWPCEGVHMMAVR